MASDTQAADPLVRLERFAAALEGAGGELVHVSRRLLGEVVAHARRLNAENARLTAQVAELRRELLAADAEG